MEHYDKDKLESLLARDGELRLLWDEHLQLKHRLTQIATRSHLTPHEELERKTLQKRKLAGKDRIASILARDSA